MLEIGEKIKELRKSQDVTQEKLADYLNISYQAVSKWENGLALPDITLIPRIANFFGVTCDELLGLKECEQTKELMEYEKVYKENNVKGKVLENIKLARTVLEIYPRNYQWMLNLAYPLISYNDTEEHTAHSKKNGFLEESIDICERILEDCTTDSIRHSAIQILCYSYPHINKTDEAIRMANEMPDFYLCKEQLLTHIYRGEEQIKACQQLLISSLSTICGLIWMLCSENLMGKELVSSQKIELLELANALFDVLLNKDEESMLVSNHKIHNYERMAIISAKEKDYESTVKYLLSAEKYANIFDNGEKSGEVKYNSLLANRLTFNPKETGKNWEGTSKEYLLKLIESNPYISKMTANPNFTVLKERLKNQ